MSEIKLVPGPSGMLQIEDNLGRVIAIVIDEEQAREVVDTHNDMLEESDTEIDLDQLSESAREQITEEVRVGRQGDVITWVKECFGEVCANDGPERGARVLEEAIELAQAAGLPIEKARHILGHVYSKPLGDLAQEVGGLSITLLAFCAYAQLSADAEEAKELDRVLRTPIQHFKKRHLEKAAAGITRDPRCPGTCAVIDPQQCPLRSCPRRPPARAA